MAKILLIVLLTLSCAAPVERKPTFMELNIKVYIVPKMAYQGYATRDNYIYIVGYRDNDRIIVDHRVLGHELNHLLDFALEKK